MTTSADWLERFTGSTRRRILELLFRSERTVQDLADELGLTPNAIRGHVAAMERDGLVEQHGIERETGGKPAVVYGVTPQADELRPKAYHVVLGMLLDVLEEKVGEAGVQDVLKEVGARAAPPEPGSPEERVEAAADILRSLGGLVEVRRQDGGWRIQGFSCPFSAITRGDARVCGLARALVEATTGGSVREVCDRGRRPRCAFEVSYRLDDR